MGTPFIAEIRIVSFNFAPKGWALCNGQILPINQNQALFSLMGTTYGGDGRTTFGLPNLQSRTPIHTGQGFTLGEIGGEFNHTLITQEMPAHTHLPAANSGAPNSAPNTPAPGAFWAAQTVDAYAPSPNVPMSPAAIASVGGSQAHTNLPPYLVLNFIVALQGVFPSQN